MSESTVLAQISADLEPHLPEWYGTGAAFAGLPEIRCYPHSFFLRFKVLAQGSEPVLLAKIQRKPEMETLESALAAVWLHEQAHDEFQVQQKIWQAFSIENDAECVAVQPLAYFEKWNAIILPELALRPLKSYLMHGDIVLRPEKAWKQLEPMIRKAARWLLIFHTRVGNLRQEPFAREGLQAEIEARFLALHEYSAGQLVLGDLRKRMEALLLLVPDGNVPVAGLHYDYQWSNVMVMPDGKICALDPRHMRREPVYADLATFLIDPVTRAVEIFSSGFFFPTRQLAFFREQVLDAYFGENAHDENLLNLYCALAAMHKWSMNEKKMKKKGLKQSLLRPAIWPMRRYFAGLISQYISATG